MRQILRDPSDDQIVAAIEQNFFDFFIMMNQTSADAELHNDQEILWTVSDIPFPLFNGVVRADLKIEYADMLIQNLKRVYSDRHVPWTWQIGPSSHPIDLKARLVRSGLQFYDTVPGLAIRLNELRASLSWPAGLTILQVGDAGDLEKWIGVVKEAFKIPEIASHAMLDTFIKIGFDNSQPIIHYLGVMDNNPIAASTLYMGAGVAGIYNVSTHKSVRRQGIGAALTMAGLIHARALGYRIGVLEASNEGFSVYTRLGFKQYCTFEQLIAFAQ